jgi:hypothetical protein
VAWEDYAGLYAFSDWTGRTYYLTGFTWFVKLTTILLDLGLAQVDTPPAIPGPASPVAFAAADGVLQSIVTWTTPGGTATKMDIWHLGPISKGRAPKIEAAVHGQFVNAETATYTYTGLTPGRHWFFGRMALETNGLVSTFVLDYADITAA